MSRAKPAAEALLQRSAQPAFSSMTFFAPHNDRCSAPGARGVSAVTSSRSQEVAIGVAIVLVGTVTAGIVNAMLFITEFLHERRLELIINLRKDHSLAAAWLAHLGFALACAAGAFACVIIVPMSRGSGLPQLIAYLNGVKIPKFTSAKVLTAKVIGTSLALVGGFFCGPEGPIIHIGGCVGKLLLRALYHAASLPPQRVFRAFASLRNDLDQRDFVALGAGAGVAAAFSAPVSGVLFVVEEAASHFSLSLLWRTFSAAMYAPHRLSKPPQGCPQVIVSSRPWTLHLIALLCCSDNPLFEPCGVFSVALWASHWLTLFESLAEWLLHITPHVATPAL